MRNNDYENTNSKIPYDNDTILRQANYKKPQRGRGNKVSIEGSSKVLALLMAILIIFNVIIAIVVFTRKDGNSTVNNNSYSINSDGLDVTAVTMKALPSAVLVNAGLNGMTAESLNAENFPDMASRGAGVIIEDDKDEGSAYILTCNHVITNHHSEIYVLLSDSFVPIKAQRIYSTVAYDLAVIKIEKQEEYKRSSAKACAIADSTYVALGEDVVAIGNPQGRGFSITEGVVSVTSELIDISGSSVKHRVMRISSPINLGNSGGGLFNARGELLGIVSAKSEDTSSSSVDCIAYAIPSTLAINIAHNIMANKIPSRASFGLTLAHDVESGIEYRVVDGKTIAFKKVYIQKSTLFPDTLRVNDVIVSFRFSSYSVNMVNMYTLEDYAFAMAEGTVVTFDIIRGGVPMTVSVTVNNVVRADS